MNTFVVGMLLNEPVAAGRPFIMMLMPIVPSVLPAASISIACSMRSSTCSLTSTVHITPLEMIALRLDVSYGVPASAARSSSCEDRLGERVADDRDRRRPLALDGAEQLGGVERTARQRHHAAAAEVRHHRPDPHPGAVHQRGAGDRHDAVAAVDHRLDHRRDLGRVGRRGAGRTPGTSWR